MDTELLRTFVEVTQTRHFGRAADNLFLTPAAVSARIRQLEQILGVSLFYRTRGNIQTTAEGQRLLPHAHQLLEVWALARRDMAQEADVARPVSIGATSGLWRFVLDDLNRRLYRELPDLRVRAEAYSQAELIERLLAEQLDMAVVYDLPGDAVFKSQKIGQLKLALLSSEPNAELKSALRGDYVYVDWGAAFELFHARRVGEINSRLYTNQAGVALEVLRQGPASAYLPESLTSEQLRPVPGAPGFSRPLYVAFRPEQAFAPGVQSLLELLGSG